MRIRSGLTILSVCLLVTFSMVAIAQGPGITTPRYFPWVILGPLAAHPTANLENGGIYWNDGTLCAGADPCLMLYYSGTWNELVAGGGGGGAPTDAKYIVQEPDATLSAEQALSALATGLVKNTTSTGVLSIATAGTDYYSQDSHVDHDQTTNFSADEHFTQANITTVGTVATGTWNADTIAIANGGTGQTTQQAAIDALTNVAAATNEHVLTKDTATGNAIFKAATGGGGVSIGDAVGSGTSGSILYVDASTQLAEDNSNLFYDATNKWLGIGNGAPDSAFHAKADVTIATTRDADPTFHFRNVAEDQPLVIKLTSQYGALDAQHGSMGIIQTRTNSGNGKFLIDADLVAGDEYDFAVQQDGDIEFGDWLIAGNIFSYNPASATVIDFRNQRNEGYYFRTQATDEIRLQIAANGDVAIGAQTPDTKLDVDGAITIRELSADPSDPDEGSAAIWMSDGTGSGDDGDLYAKITSGGATVTAPLYNGGNYASIYVTGGTTAQSIATGATPTKSTAFTTNGLSRNTTADATNDKITITDVGIYKASLSVGFGSGTAAVIWVGHLYLNGVAQPQCRLSRKTPVTDVGSASLACFIDVTSAPWDLDFRWSHDNGGAVDNTIAEANLLVEYIGET